MSSNGTEKGKTFTGVLGAVWYFFNSLKLTLGVLITLAVVSIVGTVIEQNQPVQNYIAEYGEQWTRYIIMARFHDMYHSWWFLALLVALTLNIIVCTFERFPPKWKSLLNHKAEFNPSIIGKFSNNRTIAYDGSVDEARGRVEAVLKKRKFKFLSSNSDGSHNFYAWKGLVGRFGSDVVHISLLLILLGAILGSLYGYKDFKVVYVGNSMKVPQSDFEVRLDKFWIEYYETGQIRQYNSLLTVVENGKEVMEKQIWVNEPLYYKGIRFYQSSYGMAWSRVESADVAIMKKGTNSAYAMTNVKWNERATLPGTKYSVKLVGYVSDFAFDEGSGQVFSKSPDPENPAIYVEVYEGEKLVNTPWLFLNYPGIFPAIPGSNDDLAFMSFTGTKYSGISINKDPGTNVVWAGCIVMGLGFYLAFFVYHRRFYITIRPDGPKAEVRIGGTINKNNFVFERELGEITSALSQGSKGSGGTK